MKRNKEISNEGTSSTYEFFDDHFKFTSSIGTNYNVEYNSIAKFAKTKKLVVLISKAKMAYWFPADSFEAGNLDEFEKFLRSKDIK